ncbi:MAG: TraB/GumN family protein [Planctomycetes bacterium]|nr:TraB/GumN family protein [Planctomycetota bacterium]
MNNLIKSCSVAALTCFALALSCSPAPVSEQPAADALLWKVSKGSSTSYLFGTMHVADPRVTTLKPVVEDAFGSSDAVFSELKESALEMGVKAAEHGMLPAGTKLYDIIPADMYSKLSDFVVSNKMSMQMIDGLRPWMVSMQLSLIDAMKYMKGVVLDMQLTIRANKEGKVVGGVETIEDQFAALAFGTDEEQILLLGFALDKMIKHASDEKTQIDIMLEHYLIGDIDALWEMAESELKNASELELAAFDALLAKRNVNMAQHIHQRFGAHPDSITFYAFGALHFAGPQSVNQLLKNMGYSVERVVK